MKRRSMSEYKGNCKGYGSGVKPSRIINSIGGKQRRKWGSLTFSPNQNFWMILPKQIIILIFPYSFLFLLYQTVQMQFINTSSIVIKSQIVAKQSIYQKIVLPFLAKYNSNLQFVQNIVFIKSLL